MPPEIPANYPSEYIETITMDDGSQVLIRPIRPDDAARLQSAFSRLSPETIYMRFLEVFRQLSDKQARDFSNLDYSSKMAFVGLIEENCEEQIVVVARYAMTGVDEPGVAEAAIVVRDDFQRRGLGTIAMLKLLNYAQQHGVKAFLGTIHIRNDKIMSFIQRGGLPVKKKMIEPGIWEVRVYLNPNDIPEVDQV